MSTLQSQSFLPPVGWLNQEDSAQEGPGLGFLLAMTVAGFALRLFLLDNQSLWVDEIMTWKMVRPGVGLNFWTQTLDSIQGPLYQVLVWPLLRWQDSGMMLRIPAAVAGAASIPFLGMIAGKLFGSRTAQLATIFWVINPFHIWYCQEARGYSFLILFILVAAYFYLKMEEQGPSLVQAVAFGLACAAAVWSNMSALFFWAAMGTSWLVLLRAKNKGHWFLWVFAFGLTVVAVAPWILKAMGIWAVGRVIPGVETGVELRGDTTFSIIALPYTLFTFFFGYSWGPSLRELHSPHRLETIISAWPLLAAGALPMMAGLVYGFSKASGRRLLLLFWIIIPVAILVILAMRNVKPWNPRYVMVALPWLIILAAHGFSGFTRKWGTMLALLMGVVSLYSLGNYYFQSSYYKADIQTASTWLETHNSADEAMLVPVVTGVFNYYYGGNGEVLDTFGRPELKNSTAADVFVKETIIGHDVLWIILAREWYFDPDDRMLISFARHGQLHLELEKPGVRIYKWQR